MKLRQNLWHQFGWIGVFPLVLATTLALKLKYRLQPNSDYQEHLQAVYRLPWLTDDSDKFAPVRKQIAQLAAVVGKRRVLDVATGAGWQAQILKEIGFKKVIAIDLVPERIEFCARKYQGNGIDFRVMDATQLDFPDKYFDCVVISAALHDMPQKIRHMALKEFARVSKKRVILFEPKVYKNRYLAMIFGAISELFDESMYIGEYIRDDLETSLADNNLQIISRYPVWWGIMEITVCEPTN